MSNNKINPLDEQEKHNLKQILWMESKSRDIFDPKYTHARGMTSLRLLANGRPDTQSNLREAVEALSAICLKRIELRDKTTETLADAIRNKLKSVLENLNPADTETGESY